MKPTSTFKLTHAFPSADAVQLAAADAMREIKLRQEQEEQRRSGSLGDAQSRYCAAAHAITEKVRWFGG